MENRLEELVKPKITYKEIARRYGCSISFVGHIAAGRCKPPARFKLLVSELLGLPVATIFPGADEKEELRSSL